MILDESVLQSNEKIIFALRALYLSRGYGLYKMSKFEEYDLYAGNKDFLVSDNVITFTDLNGKLMALKPDVTLSIIKNSTDIPDKTVKLFYNENVYRAYKNTGSFKEIMQMGVECIGRVNTNEILEVILLAAESLCTLSSGSVLAISDLDILKELIAELKISAKREQKLYKAISEKNAHEIIKICEKSERQDTAKALAALVVESVPSREAAKTVESLLCGRASAAYKKFKSITEGIAKSSFADKIVVDFSVIDDVNYYNGVVFKGFISGIPTPVLSGGQYDNLMRKLERKSCAVGFAVYTDALERTDIESENREITDNFVNIALPKGRLGEKVYKRFAEAGFDCPSILETNRKLVFENKENGVRFFWVKPSDVSIYVERGAADIGVAGKDILLEYEPDVYELADLETGKCRMAVAAPRGFCDDRSSTLKVATKFALVAKRHFLSRGRDIDIIHLNGSIELAPILKLSDVIVDIVETGTTLKENNLEIVEEIFPISARLIANKSAYKFKGDKIRNIVNGLKNTAEENK